MQNSTFKQDFVNFFADELNSTYLPENVIGELNKFKLLISDEIDDHTSRWGNWLNVWSDQFINMERFANERPAYIRQYLEDYFILTSNVLTLINGNPEEGTIRINNLFVSENSWSGMYFEGIPIQLQAIPEPGYEFVRWEGDIGTHQANEKVDLTRNMNITAVFEPTQEQSHQIVIN